jgi:7-carboxy-7-deazaguanine synthase
MDIKCPGSGMVDSNHLANLKQLSSKDELKFVLRSQADYLWAVDFLKENNLLPARAQDKQQPQILFSAVTQDLDPAKLASWVLTSRLPIRLQLQLHTLLWPDKNRGV